MSLCAVLPKSVAVAAAKCRLKRAARIDPLSDVRWDEFLQRHPRSSLFHSSAWLNALRKTYGYDAVAYTSSRAESPLENAIVFCRVKSWLTGRRLVSLPFADYCEPLVDSEEDANVLAATLEDEVVREGWDYVEIRPLEPLAFPTSLHCTTVTYSVHKLDLRPGLDVLFENLHRSSTQRKIRRAEREGLSYREGSTREFLDHFYRLFTMTRRRHMLPPQPKAWFANLMECFGQALRIRLACRNDQPVAAIITITHKDTLSYKYGACDARFNNLGCMHLLFWRAIQDAKQNGLCFLDFGRTNAGQHGLVTFKNRWGASQSVLTYSRYGISKCSTHYFDLSMARWKSKTAKYVVSRLPSSIVSKIGQMLYGHAG
jgi:lipid II:glycine glycyltransferase (peptidoglycan interpeptide bridge formation enzyme)